MKFHSFVTKPSFHHSFLHLQVYLRLQAQISIKYNPYPPIPLPTTPMKISTLNLSFRGLEEILSPNSPLIKMSLRIMQQTTRFMVRPRINRIYIYRKSGINLRKNYYNKVCQLPLPKIIIKTSNLNYNKRISSPL